MSHTISLDALIAQVNSLADHTEALLAQHDHTDPTAYAEAVFALGQEINALGCAMGHASAALTILIILADHLRARAAAMHEVFGTREPSDRGYEFYPDVYTRPAKHAAFGARFAALDLADDGQPF